jgi:hypothetical protein
LKSNFFKSERMGNGRLRATMNCRQSEEKSGQLALGPVFCCPSTRVLRAGSFGSPPPPSTPATVFARRDERQVGAEQHGVDRGVAGPLSP